MRDKITVYGLLSKIYNNCPNMPKRINCCGYEYEWDDGYQDYLRTDDEKGLLLSFLDNHNDNLYCFLQDEVEIIEEKEIEKLTLNGELIGYGSMEEWLDFQLNGNEKKICSAIEHLGITINNLIDEINKLKENK